MYHNNLPTRATLYHRGIDISLDCLTCGHHSESQHHIFFECANIKPFWLDLINNSTDPQHLNLIFSPLRTGMILGKY